MNWFRGILSQVLAEIVTRSNVIDADSAFPKECYFFGIYVDDILGIVHKDHVDGIANKIMNGDKFLKLKVVRENEFKEIVFLNVSIRRSVMEDNNKNKNRICFKWFQKDCSARRILDFQSSHPLYMKRNICDEFNNNALSVSDKQDWNKVEGKLWSIFVRSNYPK